MGPIKASQQSFADINLRKRSVSDSVPALGGGCCHMCLSRATFLDLRRTVTSFNYGNPIGQVSF